MVKVECDGCGAPYQIDEKRVPATGLKMRCPKCGKNLLVMKPAQGDADLPAVAATTGGPSRPPLPRPGSRREGEPGRAPPDGSPAVQAGHLDEIDLPGVPGGGGGGFGEIDLGVDFPAVGTPAARGAPPPARRPPPVPKPPGPPPAASAPPPPEPFGELDLPAPAFGEVDLPAQPFGEVDLPAPAFGADLPAPAFGHVDFPAPVRGADLPAALGDPQRGRPVPPVRSAPRAPSEPDAPPPRRENRTVNFGDIDLPMAPSAPALPEPAPRPRNKTVNFGDIDLPSLPDDLPVTGGRGFGEIDLPLASDAAGLPAALGASLPSPAGVGGLPAPMPAGLPLPSQGSGLPMAASGVGLPSSAGAGLPMNAGSGLPMSLGAGLPVPAGSGLPMAAGAGLPLSAQSVGFPANSYEAGLPSALEAGLPEHAFADALPSAVNVFDDSDRAVPGDASSAGSHGPAGIDLDSLDSDGGVALPRVTVGSEVDLGASAPATDLAESAPAPRRDRPDAASPVKRSKAARIGVLVGVLAAITGGALTLVPSIGPFGAHFVMDRLNEKAHVAALADLRTAVSALLDEDTFEASSSAIDRCRAARVSMPRYQKAAGYCALVTTERGVRFGRRTEDEALAKQLLADAPDDGGDAAVAASAALELLAGQIPKARSTLAPVTSKAADDPEIAALAGAIELADKAAGKAALTAWSQAVASHKSARTLFGLARADVAVEDPAAAETNARAVLKASPAHAGARILIATLIGGDPAKEADALALLKEVTDPKGPANAAASDADKVAAFAETGMIHLGRSRMSQAEQAFASALKINPLAVTALIGNGELFYRSGRYSEAAARFEAASNADPENVVAKVGIGKTFIALERMREAKDLLKKMYDATPKEPLVALWLGRAEEVLGNKKEAETRYGEAIKAGGSGPVAVDAYVALVRLLSSIGRTDDANAKLAEAGKKFPDLPALHRARGELALQLGRYEEARSELEVALAKMDDLGTRFHLAVALRRLRRYDDASAEFDKVAAVDADYPGLALERGVISQETGKTERALELYRKALEKAPNDIDLKLRVGQVQVMAGHPLEAEKILDEVRRARPNSAEANHYLGRVLLAKGESLAEAARYLELAAQIDGNRPEYHLYVGWVANEQGNAAKAGAALNRALELDHDLGDAYWQRGVLLQKQGATTDALRDLRTALEKNPSRLEAWATIASCDQDLQKWDEAERAWRAAIAGNHDVAEWHYRLGKLLRDHGSRAGVAPEMEAAVTLGERPNQTRNAWLLDAHLILADALRGSDRPKAIENYQRFLALAPAGNPYRKEAEDALRALGAPPPQ